MRDASRSSRNVARVAMDAAASGELARRTKRPQRTAKSCGPGAATVASILSGLCWRGNGDNKRRSPGRARISRQTLRGESRRGRLHPWCFARVLRHAGCPCALRAGSTGAFGARLSLRPLFGEGTTNLQSSGENRAVRMRACVSKTCRPLLPRPACGERSDCIVRCNPGEGVQVYRWIPTRGESPSPQPSPRKSGARERTSAPSITSRKSSRRYRAKCSSAPCPSRCAAIRRPRTRASAS